MDEWINAIKRSEHAMRTLTKLSALLFKLVNQRELAQLSLLALSAGHFRVCRADKRESNQWGAFGNLL